jgi:serine/threonine protein phosphatase 1
MRILAIGDIHGCSQAFDSLLDQVKPTAEDRIITLGDYVDRGPDTRGILDRLVRLHEGGHLVALRGNHEVMMVEARRTPGRGWLSCGGRETLESYATDDAVLPTLDAVPEKHWKFIEETCVNWYETENHFYVHANAYPDLPLAEQPDYMLLWEKLDETRPHSSGKVMVCGHTPQRNGLPLNRLHTICLDTGAYRGGWLTCLDVVSGRFWQANQKGETRTAMIDMFVDC